MRSGLSALIRVQVLSFVGDAMVAVALAGTVFFDVAAGQQRGNVLGYLLVTMAPFAVVAPVIGPVLDRWSHGRRWALAGSAFGRALLALLMAFNFDDVFVLFPLALGSLVLSKAYGVLRASAAPRVAPPMMTLVSVNARLSVFGLAATVVGGGMMAGLLRLTHAYAGGLGCRCCGIRRHRLLRAAAAVPRRFAEPGAEETGRGRCAALGQCDTGDRPGRRPA